MLTKRQIEELQPLTKHSKFGKLLADAIEVWKVADPIQNEFGVIRNTKKDEDGFEIYEDCLDFTYERKCCCLIGAASLYKEGPDSYLDDGDYAKLICKNTFSLSYIELDGLIRGFDGNLTADSFFYSQEAFTFASEVRKIIFGE